MATPQCPGYHFSAGRRRIPQNAADRAGGSDRLHPASDDRPQGRVGRKDQQRGRYYIDCIFHDDDIDRPFDHGELVHRFHADDGQRRGSAPGRSLLCDDRGPRLCDIDAHEQFQRR